MLAAEETRHQANPGEMLDCLHFVVRADDGAATGHRAMVCEKQTVMSLDVLAHGVGELRRRRRAVFGDGNTSQRGDDFRQDGARERDTSHRKPRCGWWMRVDDGVHVRAIA